MGWRIRLAQKRYAQAKVVAGKVGRKALVYRGRLEKSMERTQAAVGFPPLDLPEDFFGSPKKTKRKR